MGLRRELFPKKLTRTVVISCGIFEQRYGNIRFVVKGTRGRFCVVAGAQISGTLREVPQPKGKYMKKELMKRLQKNEKAFTLSRTTRLSGGDWFRHGRFYVGSKPWSPRHVK